MSVQRSKSFGRISSRRQGKLPEESFPRSRRPTLPDGVAATAAFAARGLTPAWLSDYNLLQYEISRRGYCADLSWGGFKLF